MVVGVLAIYELIRNDGLKVFLLELVVTLAHISRHLVQVLLAIDRSTEEQATLRILRGQDLLPGHRFDLHLTLVIREHDRRFAEVNRGRLHRAFVAAKETHLAR